MTGEPRTPLQVLRDLVVERTRVDPDRIQPDSRLVDFGIDSVRAMEIVVDLERIFDLSIPDQDLLDIETLAQIADYIEQRKNLP